jgi:ABC-type branched-subunit amino acid transport system substrate-binding protein
MAMFVSVPGPRCALRPLRTVMAVIATIALSACATNVPGAGGQVQAPAGSRPATSQAVPPAARAQVPPAPPAGNPTPSPMAAPTQGQTASLATGAMPASATTTDAAAVTDPAAEPRPGLAPQAKIAALLPLSGPNAAIGAAMLDAMAMAHADAKGGIPVDLLPRDTGGTPEGARAAAASALEAGATILVGPVFGSEVPAVSVLARGANVPVLGLTNNATTAAPGVFVMGLLPQVQVDRLTSFARAKGARRFALVAPNDDHGRLVEAALRTAVAAGGGQLVAVERHGGDMPGMSAAVKRIAAAIDRIDALMIAGNEDTLLLSASFVPYHDIDAREKLVLVATVTWDDPRLPREVALYGAYLAAPLTQRREEFQRRFREAYKREAPRLAALGYDAAALAIAAIREAGEGPLVPVLTTPDGFEGYEGFFRLLPDGGNLRQLPILQLQRGGPRVVDDPGSAAN